MNKKNKTICVIFNNFIVLLSERYLLYESWINMKYENKLKKALNTKDSILLESIFEDIYKEYYNLIAYIISKYENDIMIVEELINDVFYNFYINMYKKEITNIKYYLVTSSKNITINHFNKKKLNIIYNDEIILSEKEHNPSTMYNEIIKKMEKILTEYEINIIILHDVYEYSFKELSSKYKKPFSSINSTYHRAIKKFKEKYNEF